MLEIVAIPLTTPPNSPEMVISVDTNKLCTLIIDLIGPIRTTMKIPELYRQLTWKLLGTLPKRYRRINWVADTIQEVSIKSCEILDCSTSVRLMIISPASKVPSDFIKIMKCGENKSRLINLIYEVISSDYKRALALLKCNEIFF